MGEHSDSSLYILTDLLLPAVEKLKLKLKARSMQPTRTLLWPPGTGKRGNSTLCSTLAASLPDSTDPRSMKRQNSASGNHLRDNGGQDHEGVLKGGGNGEPGDHLADG